MSNLKQFYPSSLPRVSTTLFTLSKSLSYLSIKCAGSPPFQQVMGPAVAVLLAHRWWARHLVTVTVPVLVLKGWIYSSNTVTVLIAVPFRLFADWVNPHHSGTVVKVLGIDLLAEMVQRRKAPSGTADHLPVRDDWEIKYPRSSVVRSIVLLAIHRFSRTCHKTGTTSGPSLWWIYLLSRSLPVDQGMASPPPDGTLLD